MELFHGERTMNDFVKRQDENCLQSYEGIGH